MSQENVEFVKTMFAASSGMDKHALLAALPEFIEQTCDPEIEWIEDPQRADGRIYRGHEGVRESWEQWLDQWNEWGFELERIVDCGDSVLVIAREHGRGTTSGAAVSARNFMEANFYSSGGEIWQHLTQLGQTSPEPRYRPRHCCSSRSQP